MQIGKSPIRIDALSKARGEAPFPGDIDMPGQLYMKTVFSDRPHAIVKSIDIKEAEKIEGVILVLTARDVPENSYGLIMPDQPVLCGPGSDNLNADRVRSVCDQLVCIIAETEQIANKAAESIIIEYEDLAVVSSLDEAIAPDAPLVHPERGTNELLHYKIRHGDIDKGFSEADVIVESTYETPVQEHAYLQPEAGLGYVDDNGVITIIVAGQWTHEDQEQIAHSLKLPLEKIRVIYPAIGGAFGGREDMSIQITLALAASKLHEKGINRPVKTIWSREESIVGHHKRHAYKIHSKWGATSDGKITAAEIKLYADAGAYAYTSTKVQGNATQMCSGPYEIENVFVDSFSIYTNNIPGGAFRGFGGPQAAFSAEMQINKLAKALNMDPVEIRLKNILKDGSILSVGTPLPPGVSLEEVVETCANKAGWIKADNHWSIDYSRNTSKDYIRKGIGFACGYKNVGFSFGAPEKCNATIELHGKSDIEKVVLRHAGAEVGQGSHTAFVQMAAEAIGVDLEKVQLISSDTSQTDNSGSVSASRMTFMAGNAIYGAAKIALENWIGEDRPAIGKFQYIPPKTTPFDKDTGECEPNFAYGYVAEAVELEVDTETGEIRLCNVICADDVGKAINPQGVIGQIEGAIVQAAGYTLLENFVQEKGFVKTPLLSNYLIPTVLDIPDKIDSIIIESSDPRGPWGAKGMGEMPYIPFAPAVASALYDATGVWIDEFPLTPERVLKCLGKLEEN